MTQKQIVLLQPHLGSLDGHEHTQIRALAWLLPQHRLTVVTGRGCALAEHFDDVQLLQLFASRNHSRRGRFFRPAPAGADAWQAFHAAMQQALAITRASVNDLLLVPSAGPGEIAALVEYMERENGGACPPVLLRILSEDVVSRLGERLPERIRRLCHCGRMVLFTETRELRRRIDSHHGLPVRGALHLPCTVLPGSVAPVPSGQPARDEISIGVLGRQRSEKGSYRIPAILFHLRRLATRNPGDKKICLVYQAVRSKRFRRFVLEARTRINVHTRSDVRIKFIDSGVSGPAFRRLMLDMDVLLLPYDIRRYRYSGSGIITDAVVARKPIVHSRGMAMNELLIHGNAEAAESDREFAEKLLKTVTRLPRYQQGARDASVHLQTLFDDAARRLIGDPISAAD